MVFAKTQKVLFTFAIIIIVVGLFSFLALSIEAEALIGLAAGAISAGLNYYLLHLAMIHLSKENMFLSLQLYIARILIYMIAVFCSVKLGLPAVIEFAAAIVSISLAIFIVYGIGGLKSED